MATATVATAAGAAALLYYTLKWKLYAGRLQDSDEGEHSEDERRPILAGRNRVSQRPAQAPATWLETISTLSETLRFTYSETLGKWPIGDLAFGINFLLKRQGNLHVASIYAGEESIPLKGVEVVAELKYLLNLLTLCWHFSKKPFPLFLEATGYSEEDVLLQKPKAGIVGHSLGGGTAALLTYTLREQKEFATAACVTFAPAACMTWELAESGRHFATSIINGADLVPSFSAASVDDLRAEVTASAWINDLRSQIEQTRILSTVYRSASALGSRLPSIASARARVAGAGAILRPVSNGTQVVVTRAKSVAQAALRRPPLHLSSWSCIGPRYRKQVSFPNSRIEENIEQQTTTITENGQARLKETITVETTEIITSEEAAGWSSDPECSRASKLPHTDDMEVNGDDTDEDISDQRKPEESMTEYELWQQLENELYKTRSDEEAEMENEIREEENAAASAAQEDTEVTPQGALTETKESQRFYPPGKIMHIVTLHPEEETGDEEDAHTNHDCKIEIYSTPRSLYGKLRLSQSMINDHYMPIYRRNIEQLISILEKDCHGDGSIS